MSVNENAPISLYFTAKSDKGKDGSNEYKIPLQIESGKKCSYLLPTNTPASGVFIEVPKPSSFMLKAFRSNQSKSESFVFAGLEIISNARNVELYEIGTDEKEAPSYLSTQRGIRCEPSQVEEIRKMESSNNGLNSLSNDLFKVVITHPQGSTDVGGVLLKLLSLKPNSIEQAHIVKLQVKCRLRDPQPQSKATNLENDRTINDRISSGPQARFFPPQGNEKAAVLRTENDVNDALTIVSTLIRTTENRIIESFERKMKEFDDNMKIMSDQLKFQNDTIIEQNRLLIQQQQQISEREKQIHSLLEKQNFLIEEFQSKLDNIASIERMASYSKVDSSDRIDGTKENNMLSPNSEMIECGKNFIDSDG